MTKKQTTFSLKDQLFNKDKITHLANLIHKTYSSFKKEDFIKDVMSKLPNLELKERIDYIASMLEKYLPKDFIQATQILIDALPEELDPNKTDDDFGDFIFAPIGEFIAVHGCKKEYLDFSLNSLKEATKRFSVEWPIRNFINTFPEETLNYIKTWSTDKHYHVRRLSSEGTRPRLPWAKRITLPITVWLKVLDGLFYDKTRFVTRSVANHLNDISKIEPQLVIDTLHKWKQSEKQEPKEMDFIIKHSLRTLIKEWHSWALELLWFSKNPLIQVSTINIEKTDIHLGEYVNFSFTIDSKKEEKLLIDYKIHFMKSGGKSSAKVFKIKQIAIKPGKTLTIEKKHLLQAMTTKALYPGKHTIELQINGKSYWTKDFYLHI